MQEQTDWRIRTAGPRDVETLVEMRRAMFAEMGYEQEPALSEMEEASRRYFAELMPTGDFLGWIVETPEGQAVGCGAAEIVRRVPTASNPKGVWAYVLNVYTVPERRRQGIATAVMVEIMKSLREADIAAVSLHATAEGRRVYERLGFFDSHEMRAFLAETSSGGQGPDCDE